MTIPTPRSRASVGGNRTLFYLPAQRRSTPRPSGSESFGGGGSAVDADLKVDVWAGGEPRVAHAGNHLAAVDLIAGGNQPLREVTVQRGNPLAVIDDDDFPIPPEPASVDHPAIRGGEHWRAPYGRDIDAGVYVPDAPHQLAPEA